MGIRGSAEAAHLPVQMSEETIGGRDTICALIQFSLEVVHVRHCLCRPI